MKEQILNTQVKTSRKIPSRLVTGTSARPDNQKGNELFVTEDSRPHQMGGHEQQRHLLLTPVIRARYLAWS